MRSERLQCEVKNRVRLRSKTGYGEGVRGQIRESIGMTVTVLMVVVTVEGYH